MHTSVRDERFNRENPRIEQKEFEFKLKLKLKTGKGEGPRKMLILDNGTTKYRTPKRLRTQGLTKA